MVSLLRLLEHEATVTLTEVDRIPRLGIVIECLLALGFVYWLSLGALGLVFDIFVNGDYRLGVS